MATRSASLLSDFALNAPDSFANKLEAATTEEIFQILSDLPNASAAAVLSRLQPHKTSGALSETTPKLLDWLADADLEDAKSILIRLPQDSRNALVLKLPDGRHRLSLQRFLNYPEHTLGRYVSNSMLCVPDSMSTAEVLQAIRAHSSGTPVLAVNGSGSYAGVLDARRVLEGNHDVPIKKYLAKVSPLRAESSVIDAMEVKEWQMHSVLPVVDYDNQVLGVVGRGELISRLGQASENTRPLDSLLTLFQLYMKVLVGMMDTVFKIRKQ